MPDPTLRSRQLPIGLAFLVYEAIVIAVLTQVESDLLFIAIALLAAGAGYLLLGVFSGSWISVILVPLPVLLALVIGGTDAADSPVTGEVPLYVTWTFLCFYFVPVWLAGLLISFVRNRAPGNS